MRSIPLLGSLGVAFLAIPSTPALAQPAGTAMPAATCTCWVPVQAGQPGAMMAPGMMAPGMAPPVAVAVEAAEPWEEHRLGAAFRVGTLVLNDIDGIGQGFSTAGIAVRYRLSRRFEAELAHDAGEDEPGLATAEATTASLLFHMRPHARWDWYLSAGAGATLIDHYDGFSLSRGHVAVGGGLERRFRHLVLGVDLRLLAQEQVRREIAVAPPVEGSAPQGSAELGARSDVSWDEDEDESVSEGQITLHATWYF